MAVIVSRERPRRPRISQFYWEAICQDVAFAQIGFRLVDNSMTRRIVDPVSGSVCELFNAPSYGLVYWRICQPESNGRISDLEVREGINTPADTVAKVCGELMRRRLVAISKDNASYKEFDLGSRRTPRAKKVGL